MDRNLRICHNNEFIDIPVNILERYPLSPLYICVKFFPDYKISFDAICDNLSHDLTYGTFLDMCDVICDRCYYSDASKKVREFLKLFNLVDPIVEAIFERANYKYLDFHIDVTDFLYHNISFLKVDSKKYQFLCDKFASNPKIVPVQVIWAGKKYLQQTENDANADLPNAFLTHISIYDGLPIYSYKNNHKFVLDNTHVNNYKVDINKIRLDVHKDRYKHSDYISSDAIITDNIHEYIKCAIDYMIPFTFRFGSVSLTEKKYHKFPFGTNIKSLIDNVIKIVTDSCVACDTTKKITCCGFVRLP